MQFVKNLKRRCAAFFVLSAAFCTFLHIFKCEATLPKYICQAYLLY